MHDAQLRGRQADPDRVAHDPRHPGDLGAQLLVEALDRHRPGLQHRIAELAHHCQRRGAPRRGLGIERRTLLVDLVGHLLNGLFGHQA